MGVLRVLLVRGVVFLWVGRGKLMGCSERDGERWMGDGD